MSYHIVVLALATKILSCIQTLFHSFLVFFVKMLVVYNSLIIFVFLQNFLAI